MASGAAAPRTRLTAGLPVVPCAPGPRALDDVLRHVTSSAGEALGEQDSAQAPLPSLQAAVSEADAAMHTGKRVQRQHR